MKIKNVHARQILDSRGNPTVEADVVLENGMMGRADAPSGASTGDHEALELRDGEMVHFLGKGVMKAVENVKTVMGPAMVGMNVSEQRAIDEKMMELDGTENKSKLGANAILAVSMACARAGALSEGVWLFEYLSRFREPHPNPLLKGEGIPLFAKEGVGGVYELPVPFMNVINGGAHAPDGTDFQEFMIVPQGFTTFAEKLESATEVFQTLKKILKKDGYPILVGDEGGFAPAFKRNDDALEYLERAINEAGFDHRTQILLAIDAAASELWDSSKEKYVLSKEKLELTSQELIEYWHDVAWKFPVISLEDGLDQDAWKDWALLTQELQDKVQIVGDDFLVTNVKRLQRAIEEKACNAILIKVNQIGTVTETVEAINLAHEHGFKAMVSHRSGETEDTFIADLVVGMGTGQIKTGSLSRSERVAKYNQLLRIEEYLNRR